MKWWKVIDLEITKENKDCMGSTDVKFSLEINPYLVIGAIVCALICWLL